LVSVQPETGFTELSWAYIPSSYVAGFKIFYYRNDYSGAFLFKTLWNPAIINYVDSSRIPDFYSASYQIEAIDSSENPSLLSNKLNTIFTEVKVDTCNKKITISWNSYVSSPKKVTGYSILVSANNYSFTEAGMVTSAENSFTLYDFTTDAHYCFVVKALLEGGFVSFSNKSCLNTKMQRPPQWINADYATIDEKRNITLSFTFDPLSEIRTFRLERKTASDNVFQQVAQIESGNGSLTYTDRTADPEQINFYRLSAINNCGNPVVISNLASNIVPILQRHDNVINLIWNPYKNWFGGVSGYAIYINTGDGFRQKYIIQPTDTLYSINYSEIMYDISVDEVCFYIKATEAVNPHGISGESKSVSVCTENMEKITVPNAFTPNNDMVNDNFKPVLSFTPLDYHLVITDRQNNILFESRDHLAEWDGTLNGTPLPQGVYLWFLKIKTPSAKIVSRTGNVTIIKDK
jgi:gliding motility-associated-like protein